MKSFGRIVYVLESMLPNQLCFTYLGCRAHLGGVAAECVDGVSEKLVSYL